MDKGYNFYFLLCFIKVVKVEKLILVLFFFYVYILNVKLKILIICIINKLLKSFFR